MAATGAVARVTDAVSVVSEGYGTGEGEGCEKDEGGACGRGGGYEEDVECVEGVCAWYGTWREATDHPLIQPNDPCHPLTGMLTTVMIKLNKFLYTVRDIYIVFIALLLKNIILYYYITSYLWHDWCGMLHMRGMCVVGRVAVRQTGVISVVHADHRALR